MEKNQQPSSLRELLRDLDAQGIHDSRRYDAVRKYLCFKARKKNHPISGSFELTPLCNLDCKMCYVHLQKDQMCGRPLLSVDQWKDIMQQAIDGGMMYAALTGGECLTYPGFRELYLFLRDRGIEVSILSNGLLMNAEMAAFLQKNPPAQVQVTLYGANEEDYERVTGQRAFSLVWENLLRLRDVGIPLQIAVTPNRFMQDGEALVRLLHNEGLPFIINSGLLQPRPETGRELVDADVDTYIRMMRLRAELQGAAPTPDCLPEDIPDTHKAVGEPVHGVLCGAGRSAFAVNWKGEMLPCNNFPCSGESVPVLGFDEAWHRVNKTALEFSRPIECEDCGCREICKHCAAEHAAGAPIGHASPAICDWCKQMIAAGLLTLQQPVQ